MRPGHPSAWTTASRPRVWAGVKRRGVRELDRRERPAEPLSVTGPRERGTIPSTAPASTRCTRSSTSSRARKYIKNYGMSIVRRAVPPNVTGPDKVRGLDGPRADHDGRPPAASRCTCRRKGLMAPADPTSRDMAEVFGARVCWPRRPRPLALQLGRDPGEPWRAGPTSLRGFLPDAQITFRRGGRPRKSPAITSWTTRPAGQGNSDRVYPGLGTRWGAPRLSNEVRRHEGLPLVTRSITKGGPVMR